LIAPFRLSFACLHLMRSCVSSFCRRVRSRLPCPPVAEKFPLSSNSISVFEARRAADPRRRQRRRRWCGNSGARRVVHWPWLGRSVFRALATVPQGTGTAAE
jgi:hypothetical protein